MSELEKILRKSIGKTVTIRYVIIDDSEQRLTGKLISVSDEIIVVEAVMTHYINRKATVLIGLDVKE